MDVRGKCEENPCINPTDGENTAMAGTEALKRLQNFTLHVMNKYLKEKINSAF